jgi:hypothetical protein
MSGQMLRNVDVLDGAGGVIATSSSGNYEGGTISLTAPAPAGRIQKGANYSLREGGGQTYRSTCTGMDAGHTYFHVH